MSRRRGWMFFALGIVLALGTGVMVFLFLQNQTVSIEQRSRDEAFARYAPPPTMAVPVAARPLDPGVTISAADYIMKDFPLDLVPLSAITDTKQLENNVLVRPVGQGETFQANQFLGKQALSISQQIKKGSVLFAFPIVDLMTKSNIIREGDHIDLYITLPLKGQTADTSTDQTAQPTSVPEQDLGSATALTMQNIEVFKVLYDTAGQSDTQQASASAPSALLCIVTPQDAAVLKYAKDSGGVIDFTLRSPVDTEPFDVPSIDKVEFSRRFLKQQQ